ncbi:hypothetical protein EIP91_004985 [Steccherinum ochraceum]|uniref:Uncharacterized protein n=1 Tax=Steccherinum ochraceum TaxID=92696 RepID=A0A4R0RN25_9APHY|nr:hypothetical protein EIP91_004985 [Steccherinum ochraceum]
MSEAATEKPLKINPMLYHRFEGFTDPSVKVCGEDRPFRYRHPLFVARDSEWEWGQPPCGDLEDAKTVAELRMQELSWAIRQKRGWQEKLKQPDVAERWKREATVSQLLLVPQRRLSANMINYVFTELEAYARLLQPETGIQHACNDATFCSYSLVADDISRVLRQGVAHLENVRDVQKDWHPGSNDQVLDLVHPSLYCLVYGRSWMRDNHGKLSLARLERNGESSSYFSEKYAWLPSDFFIDDSGTAHLTSPYINNLPQSNTELYDIIPTILGRFIPMFERVLGAIDGTDRPRTRGGLLISAIHYQSPQYKPPPAIQEYFPLPGRIKYSEGPLRDVPCIWPDCEYPWEDLEQVEGNDFVDYPGVTLDERRQAWAATRPNIQLPESHKAYQGALERDFRLASLRGRTVQCIVKLANIHLTPEKPTYPGGNWHVEGMLNERIVSTGIYYYDSDNISDSQLQFRTSVPGVPYHQQNDDICTQILYGVDHDVELLQERGKVSTSAGLSVAFPNIYQHCLSPFHLVDPTKPGHRKILAFFLVDPNIKIPSASDVAPQQASWMLEFMYDTSHKGIGGTYFERLPIELREIIVEYAFMSQAEANEIREDLMQERRQFLRDVEMFHAVDQEQDYEIVRAYAASLTILLRSKSCWSEHNVDLKKEVSYLRVQLGELERQSALEKPSLTSYDS